MIIKKFHLPSNIQHSDELMKNCPFMLYPQNITVQEETDNIDQNAAKKLVRIENPFYKCQYNQSYPHCGIDKERLGIQNRCKCLFFLQQKYYTADIASNAQSTEVEKVSIRVVSPEF